jgi:thiosulfate/3-mercaptopyruvate sulfurtransferase
MDRLVTPAWLRAHLDDPDLLVADCRYDLATPGAARAAYLEAHVPGAVYLDLDDDLSGPRGDGPNLRGRHPLPTPAAFAAAARRAGISGGTRVVAYDQAMAGGAARLWWMLRALGHDACAVLAGGLAAWDGPLEAGEPAVAAGDLATDLTDWPGVASHEDLLRDVPGRVVLDVRAPERFRGEVEPFDRVAGHVPGAVNAPVATLPPAPDWLVASPGPIVAYCGSGVAACVALLALADAGRGDALLYPGSWSDWSQRDLPVETGS